MKRPNILFAFADDWVWPHASIAGDKVLRTPTFDRIARTGVTFNNAFVSAPSCTASRAAILTGQYHWRLREGANLYGPLSAEFDVYPDMLEASGYQVGYTRKGWGPGSETAAGRKRNPAGDRYQDFAAFASKRPKDKPFCFWFGSTDPHRPYTWESGIGRGMRIEDVKVPPYWPDSEIIRKDICDYYFEVERFDRETGEILAAIEKMGELDNTIVLMSGDNGWPFPRAKATLYNAGTHAPLAVCWASKIKGGRTIDDFVSLSDLCPTFLEAAGLKPTPRMTGRSLVPLLESGRSGWVDSRRDFVLSGMERHVPCRGENRGGYPMRSIRTRDYLYIRNFKPDRWPAGDPKGFEDPKATPFNYQELTAKTQLAFADVDASPTKADIILRRNEAAVRPFFDLAFGKRPGQELFDLRSDPHTMKNVAGEARHAGALRSMDSRLMEALKATGDPRGSGGGDEFERFPYGGKL